MFYQPQFPHLETEVVEVCLALTLSQAVLPGEDYSPLVNFKDPDTYFNS